MAMYEKYGVFAVKDITFYNKEDFLKFQKYIYEVYGNYLYELNGKTVKKGKFGFIPYRTSEQKDYFSMLELYVNIDDENEIINIRGFGHRRYIFSFEMNMRKKFDNKEICTYDCSDRVVRAEDLDYSGVEEEIDEFYNENQRRKSEYQKVKNCK